MTRGGLAVRLVILLMTLLMTLISVDACVHAKPTLPVPPIIVIDPDEGVIDPDEGVIDPDDDEGLDLRPNPHPFPFILEARR